MAHFTLILVVGSHFLRDKVTPGGETTFSHVNTLTHPPRQFRGNALTRRWGANKDHPDSSMYIICTIFLHTNAL